MMLVSLDIPDNPAQWPDWLEKQVVGLHLGDLVAELQVLQSPSDDTRDLAAICGEKLPSVLKSGLSVLSDSQIRNLLKHPETLLQLQELVFMEGGNFWDAVTRDGEHRAQALDIWNAIEPQLAETVERAVSNVTPARSAREPVRRRRLWMVSAIAAALLVGIGVWWSRPQATGWGWDRPGALAADLPADRYLQHLADGAEEWFERQPKRPERLEQRLTEFRHGCQTLIEAPHRQLSPQDREWLVQKCRAWAGKLDQHLADLKAGQDVQKVRDDANATVHKLIEALRAKAGELQS